MLKNSDMTDDKVTLFGGIDNCSYHSGGFSATIDACSCGSGVLGAVSIFSRRLGDIGSPTAALAWF